MKARTAGRRKAVPQIGRRSAGRCTPAGRKVRSARRKTSPGSRRRIKRFQPKRRSTRISHEVASSPKTSEFITTSRLIRSGWRAAKARAGWPPMSRPATSARSMPQASSSASSRSAMVHRRRAARPGLAVAHAGPVEGDHRRTGPPAAAPARTRSAGCPGSRAAGPGAARVPRRARRSRLPFGRVSKVVASISRGPPARGRRPGCPRWRRSSPTGPGAWRCRPGTAAPTYGLRWASRPWPHETGRHHRVHAVAIQVVLAPPTRPGCGSPARGVAVHARATTVRPGSRSRYARWPSGPACSASRMGHRGDQPGRIPAVALDGRVHHRRPHQQPAQLVAAGEREPQIGRTPIALDRQIGAHAGRLQRQGVQALARARLDVLRQLQIGADAAASESTASAARISP